jgi:hypothetical protein
MKTAAWEGLFVVAPRQDDSDLIYATSEEYLCQLLARRHCRAINPAAVPALTERSQIDSEHRQWVIKCATQGCPAGPGRDPELVITALDHADSGDAADAGLSFLFGPQSDAASQLTSDPPPPESSGLFDWFEVETQRRRSKNGSIIADLPLARRRGDYESQFTLAIILRLLLLDPPKAE